MSLPRYREYKDSGVKWIGEFPCHWIATRLTWATTVNDETLPEETSPEFDMAYVDIGSVSFERGIERTESFEFHAAPSRARRMVRDGDILISTVRTYLKAIAPVSTPPENMIVSTGFAVVRPRPNFCSGFAKYVLQADGFVDEVISRSTGISYPAINASDLVRISIPLPPFEEQFSIAVFLDQETGKIDALVAGQEKLITLLAEKRQAAITHAVTRGLNPRVAMKSSRVSWLDQVPAHWNVRPLKYLVKLKSGGTPSKDNSDYWDGDIPWASAKDLKSEQLGNTGDHITSHAVDSGAANLIQAGAILVVVRGMILARIFPVVEMLVPMAINQDLKAVIPLQGLTGSFLAWLLRGSANESLLRLDEAGHGTKALRMDAWTSMQLPIPPISEQDDIVAFLSSETAKIDRLTTEVKRAIALLKERRSALIAAAVTGQIDLRQMGSQVKHHEALAA